MKRMAILLCVTLLLGMLLPLGGATSAGAVEPITTTGAPAPADATGATDAGNGAVTTTAGSGETVQFPQMLCNVISNEGRKVVVIGGFLPDTVALPAKVEVAVPTGVNVFWVGEVAGSDSQSGDISLPLQKRTEGDLDIYSATMSQFRTLQVEYSMNTDPFSNVGGDEWAATLSYTPLYNLESLALAAEVPVGAAVMNPEFALQGPGGSGGNIYLKDMGPVNGGQATSTEITYTANATANGQTAGNSSNTVTTILIVVIIALIAVLVFVLFNRKGR